MKIDKDILIKAQNSVEVNKDLRGSGINASAFAEAVRIGHSEKNEMMPDASKSSILSDADGTIESLRNKAQVLKDNLNAIFNKMGTGTVVELDKENIDINNTDSDKLVTVVEQIQIKLAAYCDDFQATADIDAEDIKKTMGAGAAAYKMAESLERKGLKPTKENVSQALGALDKVDMIGEISEGAKAFILQNNMEPTINNVYVAANAGYRDNSGKLSDGQWNELKSQVWNVIKEAGMSDDYSSLDKGRWMIENDIEVTPENYKKLASLDEANDMLKSDELTDRIAASMVGGLKADDTILTGDEYPWEKAVRVIRTAENASAENVMAWVSSERPYTMEGLRDTVANGEEKPVDDSDYRYVKASRELNQIRLMMTIESAAVMEKNGFSIDTCELSELVEELERTEATLLGEMPEFDEVTLRDVGKINEVLESFDELKYAPSAVIGNVMMEEMGPSASAMMQSKDYVAGKMAAAGYAYEALSTGVRTDLGDSLSGAVKSSMNEILNRLGYENNEENRRVVRILAYNQMELSNENAEAVKSIDYSINQLFKNLTPKAVLQMIRDGVDPLEEDVTILNNYLNNINENNAGSVEKYSEFLYRLDRKEKITGEEREKYIGIFRMVTNFQKDGGKVAGALLKQNLPLTMGNLLTSYLTEKNQGIDDTADDVTEIKGYKDKVSYYKNLFGSIKNKITPDNLEGISSEFDDMNPENFSDALMEFEIPEDDPLYQEYILNAEEAAHMPEEVYRFVTENGITGTYNNIAAVQTILKKPEKFFDSYSEAFGDTGTEDDFLTALENREMLRKEYDVMCKKTEKLLRESVETEDNYMRISGLQNLGHGLSILSGLAMRNNYYIPYRNNDKTGVINLKVIENGENKGSFSIRIFDQQYGRTTVDAHVSNDSISAYIMTDSADGKKMADEKSESIRLKLIKQGFRKISVSSGIVTVQPDYGTETDDSVETERIFSAAKIFVENLTK